MAATRALLVNSSTLAFVGLTAEQVRTAAGAVGGTLGATDNAILRADGTGGSTVQGGVVSGTLDDTGLMTVQNLSVIGTVSTGAVGGLLDDYGVAFSSVAILASGSTLRVRDPGNTGDRALTTSNITASGFMKLASKTVATLGNASTAGAGAMYWVTDAAGSPCVGVSDGTNWKRCDDMSVTVS